MQTSLDPHRAEALPVIIDNSGQQEGQNSIQAIDMVMDLLKEDPKASPAKIPVQSTVVEQEIQLME